MAKTKYNYSDEVISAVRNYIRENFNEYIGRKEVMEMKKEYVLHYYLEWEGIYGYSETIIDVMNAKEIEE